MIALTREIDAGTIDLEDLGWLFSDATFDARLKSALTKRPTT